MLLYFPRASLLNLNEAKAETFKSKDKSRRQRREVSDVEKQIKSYFYIDHEFGNLVVEGPKQFS